MIVDEHKINIAVSITRAGCSCGSHEYILFNNIHALKIMCASCQDGYFVYGDGKIVRSEGHNTFEANRVKL